MSSRRSLISRTAPASVTASACRASSSAPGLKAGTIDHQIVSFDAYLKFIEDIFLSSQRIGGAAGLRPDSRPVVRESLTSITQPTGTGFTGNPTPVGDLLNDFNFSQTPLTPLILHHEHPEQVQGHARTRAR